MSSKHSEETQLQHDLAVVQAISWTLSQSLDLDRVLDLALETTLRVMESQVGCIHLPAESGAGELRLRAQAGLPTDFAQCYQVIPRDDPEVQRIIESGEAMISTRCRTSAMGLSAGDEPDTKGNIPGAWVCFPMLARDQFQGLMSILIKELTPQQSRLLKTVSQYIGIAVDNAQLYRRAQRDAHRLRREAERWHSLNQAAVAVGNARSQQDVYDAITRTLSSLGFSAVVIAPDADDPTLSAEPRDQALTVISAATPLPRLVRALERLTGLTLVGYQFPVSRFDFYRRVIEERQPEYVRLGAEHFGQLLPEPFAHLAPRIVHRAGLDYGIAAPLKIDEQSIGVLVVSREDLMPEDIPAITAFADQASAAIENARLIQAERHQREVAEMLRDLVVTVNSTLDVDQVLNIAVRRLQMLHQATACSVSFLDEGGETFVFRATTDPNIDVSQRITFPVNGSIAGQAIREHRVQVVNTVDPSSDHRAEIARRTGIVGRSLLTAPLFADDEPLGVIQIVSALPGTFTQADAELLATTAALIETAIARAQAYAQAVQLAQAEYHQHEVAETLRRVALLINASLDLDTVLDRILEQLAQVVNYDSTSLMLVENDWLTMRAIRGFEEPDQVLDIAYEIANNPLFQEMLASRRPILIPDVKNDGRYVHWPGSEPVRSYIGVPLVVRDRVIGQLSVDKRQPDYYDEGDAELVFTFAQQAAIAIENARLFELTRRQSERLAQTLAVSETLHRGLELEQVLGQIAQGAVGLGFRRAVINVYQPEDALVKVQATAGLEGTKSQELMGATYRWSDFQTLMQERFQISRSYLIRQGEVDLERDFQGVVVTPRLEEQERSSGYWLPENLLLVPLWGIPGELLGVLSMDEPVDGLLPDLHTIWSLEAFASQAAIAIENAQLFAGEQHQREIAESLREVSSVLNASLDLDTVLTRIMEQLRRVVEYDSAGVLLEDGDDLLFSGGLGFPKSDAIIGQRIPLSSDDPAVRVFKSRQSLVVADVKADPGWVRVPGTEHIRGWMGVPLLVRGQVIGILTVDSCQPGFYAGEHATIASAFATQAAIAIENARLYEAERARYREAEALRRAALTLTSTIALDRVFERILTELQNVVPYDSASVQLLKGDRLEIIGGRGFPNLSELLGVSFPARGDNPNALVLDSQEPVIIEDVRPHYAAFGREPHAASDIRAWLGVPLLIGDEIIGMLALDKCQPGFYTEAHARAAMAYAAQAAIAIENARLYETERERLAEMERRNRELAALHAVAAAVSSSLDTNVVLRETLAQALETIDMESGGVYLLDETGNTLTLRICHNLPQDVVVGVDRLKVGDGLSGRVIQAGEPIVVEDLSVSPLLIQPTVTEAGYQTAVAVPLRAQDRILGTFFGISHQTRRFSPQDLKLLVAIGDEMGMAVQNARLHQALQNYATELEARVEARTAEVNREREQLLAVLENAGEAIVITDADGFMEYANPAWEELTGHDAAQAMRHKMRVLEDETFPDFSLPIDPPKVKEGYGEEQETHTDPITADADEFAAVRGTTQRQRIWRRESVGQRPDGTTYVVDLTVTPVFDDAIELANLVIIYRDVTQYKELDRIKSEFLSTAAHELRSPLTSILGFSELLLLRMDLSDEERTRFLKYINDHAVHLKQLVDDLLDISRIESGVSFLVKLEPLELHSLFEQEIRSWQETHPDHNYQVFGSHEWPPVHADEDRIRQVVRNLLSNATKYSPAPGTITVSATPVGGYMEVTVADEGIGMTDEELPHIFEKFWRANASSTAVEGTGLGLVIVKHIVEQHGGHVWVESIKGEGTVAHFTLPLLERRTTVLIAEDEGGVREIEHRILASNGIATLLASNGQQALEIAQSRRPDLILLDLVMPGMSGRDVLHALKSNPATQHIPVLVVSARSSWQTIEESYMLGAVDFLTKPFEYEELLSRVRRALKIAASRQQQAIPSYLTPAS